MNIKEIIKQKGFTMKTIAKELDVPYSTVIRWSNNGALETHPALPLILDLSEDELRIKLTIKDPLPFIKWAGGKRQLLSQLFKYAPKKYKTYYEPFIGGGALLLALKPQRAVISDVNEELVYAWNAVKNDPNELITELNEHKKLDSKEHYLNTRIVDRTGEILNMTTIERASRFIYLNKAGYNGLWRVNSKGQNNVPYAYPKTMDLTNNILPVSDFLNNSQVEILHSDYKDTVANAKKDDFVYFDPPYIPKTPTSSFTSYTKDGFGLIQQQELRDTALKLAQKGVKVMLSNADVPLVYDLYQDDTFNIHRVNARRMINSKGNGRGKVGEVIITTY